MGLDIRLPLGLLFSVLGAVLVVYGALANPAIYQRSLGYNVNVIWGAVLLAFGLLFISVSRRKLEPPDDAGLGQDGRPQANMADLPGHEQPAGEAPGGEEEAPQDRPDTEPGATNA
jgi:hypothetical protein